MAYLPKVWLASGAVAVVLLLALSSAVLIRPVHAQTGLDLDVALTAATVSKSGVVTIAGTVTCSHAASTVVYASLTQAAGRKSAINGSAGGIPIACAGPDVRHFSVQLVGYNGRFGPGDAYLTLSVQGCTPFSPYPGPGGGGCDSDQLTTLVRLSRSS